MNKDIFIMGIETSCDETAAAIVQNGRTVLSNIISSQVPIHKKFGGVVPEIASRHHVGDILYVIDEALKESGKTLSDIDAFAVTHGPGLVGALLVGVSAAKGLAFALDKPFLTVNHLQGHIYANFIEHPELEPPFVALVVSGGHTSLAIVPDHQHIELLGQTLDDAAGEAFDKIARLLRLPYPGGPEIEKLALSGDENAIDFPRALKTDKYNFSFSGLKSSVINYVHNSEQKNLPINASDVAASFQAAIIDVLCEKAVNALEGTSFNKLVLAGGVSANNMLRTKLAAAIAPKNAALYFPSSLLCTDNAAMIACRGYYLYKDNIFSDMKINACPSLELTKN